MDKQENICHKFLKEKDIDIIQFWNNCDKLVCSVKEWAWKQGIKTKKLRFKHQYDQDLEPAICNHGMSTMSTKEVRWFWHEVIEIDGYIHDAWYPEILKKENYFKVNFKNQQIKILENK